MDTADTILEEAAELGITGGELDREMADLLDGPPGYIPGVGVVSGLAMRMITGASPFREPAPGGKCYWISAGQVHIQPDCRCHREMAVKFPACLVAVAARVLGKDVAGVRFSEQAQGCGAGPPRRVWVAVLAVAALRRHPIPARVQGERLEMRT